MTRNNRLLSNEELIAELWSGIIKHDSLAANDIGYPSQKTKNLLIDLFNTQKQLYADNKVVEYAKAHKETLENMYREERLRSSNSGK